MTIFFDTLANIVAYYQIQNDESYTFRAVNRLDRNTSGIVIIAKNRLTASILPNTVKKKNIPQFVRESFLVVER